jgi:hypothetical protein
MRTWKLAVTTAVAAAGLSMIAPLPAAASGLVDCEQGGSTGIRNLDYVFCTLTDTAPSGEVWLGIQVVAGQGTARLTAECVLGSLPYTVHVNYTNNGVPTSAAAMTFTCSSGPR